MKKPSEINPVITDNLYDYRFLHVCCLQRKAKKDDPKGYSQVIEAVNRIKAYIYDNVGMINDDLIIDLLLALPIDTGISINSDSPLAKDYYLDYGKGRYEDRKKIADMIFTEKFILDRLTLVSFSEKYGGYSIPDLIEPWDIDSYIEKIYELQSLYKDIKDNGGTKKSGFRLRTPGDNTLKEVVCDELDVNNFDFMKTKRRFEKKDGTYVEYLKSTEMIIFPLCLRISDYDNIMDKIGYKIVDNNDNSFVVSIDPLSEKFDIYDYIKKIVQATKKRLNNSYPMGINEMFGQEYQRVKRNIYELELYYEQLLSLAPPYEVKRRKVIPQNVIGYFIGLKLWDLRHPVPEDSKKDIILDEVYLKFNKWYKKELSCNTLRRYYYLVKKCIDTGNIYQYDHNGALKLVQHPLV